MDCDNCDEPIVRVADDEFLSQSYGNDEWVHARTHGPECKRDGRLIGGLAEPVRE